jgi:hypothetical protein
VAKAAGRPRRAPIQVRTSFGNYITNVLGPQNPVWWDDFKSADKDHQRALAASEMRQMFEAGDVPAVAADGRHPVPARQLREVPAGQGRPDVPGVMSAPSNVVSWESARSMFDHMDPKERAAIEDQLFAAGLYPDAYYAKNPNIRVPGQADADSRKAWYDALDEAVRGSTYENGQIKNAKSVQDVINERLSLQQQANVAAAGRANPVTLTNGDTLKAHLDNAAQRVLGMKHSPSDEANFTRIYHDAEVAAGQPDGQGNYTQAPDPASFAEQWLRQRYPVESEVNDMLNAGNTAVNVFSAGPGGPTLPTSSQMP